MKNLFSWKGFLQAKCMTNTTGLDLNLWPFVQKGVITYYKESILIFHAEDKVHSVLVWKKKKN